MIRKFIRSFSTFYYPLTLLFLLCSCTTLPGANSTPPVKVETNCPATGTTRAAVMPPLPNRGQQQVLIYRWNQQVVDTYIASILHSYNPSTKKLNTIVKLNNERIDEALLSNDGSWILFSTILNGLPLDNRVSTRYTLRLVRIDGQYLQTLYCGKMSLQYAEQILAWSPDQKTIVLNSVQSNTESPTIRKLLSITTLSNDKPQYVATSEASLFHGWINNTQFVASSQIPNKDHLYDIFVFDTTSKNSGQILTTTAPYSCNPKDVLAQHSMILIRDCSLKIDNQEPLLNMTIRRISLPAQKSTVISHNIHVDPTNLNLDTPMCMPNSRTLLYRVKDVFWTLNVDTKSTPSQPIQLKQYPLKLLPSSTDTCPYISRDGTLFSTSIFDMKNSNNSINIASITGENKTLVARESLPNSVSPIGWTTL